MAAYLLGAERSYPARLSFRAPPLSPTSPAPLFRPLLPLTLVRSPLLSIFNIHPFPHFSPLPSPAALLRRFRPTSRPALPLPPPLPSPSSPSSHPPLPHPFPPSSPVNIIRVGMSELFRVEILIYPSRSPGPFSRPPPLPSSIPSPATLSPIPPFFPAPLFRSPLLHIFSAFSRHPNPVATGLG